MDNKQIDELRKVCGTLPNRVVKEKTSIFFGCERLNVEFIDMPENIYKSIFHIATSTWGDDKYKNKWEKTSPLGRYMVVASALQGKTLPTALEAPKFTFLVRGLPRHCFDQMARTRIGAGFGSVGCRDNSKMDSSMILYSEYKKLPLILQSVKDLIKTTKYIYEKVIDEGRESYQVARSILPMCYHHPFVFTQKLASLLSQMKRRLCFGEEEFICGLHWYIRKMFVKEKLLLVANSMRPACDYAGRCLYSKSDGSQLFSNLFAGCERWPKESEYSEFNKSCTNRRMLEKQLGFYIPYPSSYINFTLDKEGFEKLGEQDKFLLSEE